MSSYDIEQYKEFSSEILREFFYQKINAHSEKIISPSGDKNQAWETVSELEWHPSREAHKIYAEALYQEISQSDLYR